MTRAVVVGAGLAGATTAVSLRRHGYDGEVVLLGAERHLPYERPPLSKGFLTGDVSAERLPVHPAGTYDELGIELRTARAATGLDVASRRVLLEGGDEPYDVCVLATGSESVRPPIPGIDAAGVHLLRSLDDAERLRDDARSAGRAVVLGMGFIGCEVAASLRGLGLEVTMVDRLPGPLWAQLGERLSARVRGWHEEHGVELVAEAAVEAIEVDAGRASGVRLAGGRVLPAELVVVGVGARPATGWLRDSALHLDRGGVAVDEQGRSSADRVYAVGDIAAVWDGGAHRRVEHYQSALDQGQRVAAAIAGAAVVDTAPSWFWSEQYGHVLHHAGDATGARLVERADPYAALWYRGRTLTAVATVDDGRGFRRALRRLGTEVAAEDVLERAAVPAAS